jgi:hypothetical protein
MCPAYKTSYDMFVRGHWNYGMVEKALFSGLLCKTIFELTTEKTNLNIFQSLTLNKITLKILKAFIYHYVKFTSCFNENTIKYIIL